MALVPVPQAGRLLRWNSTATALENATISDLLDEIAGAVAPDPAVRRYWLATPGVSVVAGGISLALTPGAPTVVAVAPVSRAFTPPGIALSLTPSAAGVQVQAAGNFATTLTGIALPLTPNAPAVAKSSAATLTGISLALTPGNPGVSTAANVSVSAQTVNLSMTPTAPTAAASAGGPFSFSDNFNRANGAIGNGWVAISGLTTPNVASNAVVSPSGVAGAYRPETTSADQYAQMAMNGNASDSLGTGPRVRNATDANSGYIAWVYSDGEGGFNVVLDNVTGGTRANIAGGPSYLGACPAYLRVEAQGTTIRVKFGDSSTGPWTTDISLTDSSFASGKIGFEVFSGSQDNFSGGDL